MNNTNSILEIDSQARKEMAFMDNGGNNFFSEKFSLVMDFNPYIDKMEEPRYTPEYRMVYLKKGTAAHSINFETYTLNAGDLFLVSPRSILSLKSVSDDSEHRMLAMDFPELQYMKISGLKPLMVHLSDGDKTTVDLFFELLNNILQTQGVQSNILHTVAMSLVTMVMDIDKSSSNNLGYKHFNREEEITEGFKTILASETTINRTVNYYAEKMEISDTYLNTIIKKTTNHSVMYWINEKTVYTSKLLLQNRSLSLDTVAINSGFKTVAQFCKFFKTKTGKTPSEYRKYSQDIPR